MAINKRPSVDVALLGGRIPYKKNAYVVGPFANRVNFASQQRRALNLVWAINDDLVKQGESQGLAGKDAVIVGAGLAGLTASLALSTFNCSSWVLEKSDGAFAGMRDADHRHIHPTINYWPQETIDPATFLPFFNWYHDRCDVVLDRLNAEWNRRKGGFVKGIIPHCTVKHFNYQNDKWIIDAELEDGSTLEQVEYDILILATGFGKEKFTENSDDISYWDAENDAIGEIQSGTAPQCQNYIVSGTGDGGIIEVLRLLFQSFEAGGIEACAASVIRNTEIPQKIQIVEKQIQDELTDAILHDGFPLEKSIRDDISKRLWSAYYAIVSEGRLGQPFVEKMNSIRTSVEKVTLLGEWSSPLDFPLSPYHKLLLTFAISQGFVEYYQVGAKSRVEPCATIDPGSSNLRPRTVYFTPIYHYTEKDGKVRIRTINRPKNPEQERKESFYLSRHGYNSPIHKFFDGASADTAEQIRLRQALFADQDWLTEVQADHYAEELDLTKPSDKVLWLDRRQKDIDDYFWNRHTVLVELKKHIAVPANNDHADVQEEQIEGLSFELKESNKKEYRSAWHDTSWLLPDEFMGVAVNHTVRRSRRHSRRGH